MTEAGNELLLTEKTIESGRQGAFSAALGNKDGVGVGVEGREDLSDDRACWSGWEAEGGWEYRRAESQEWEGMD